MLNLNENIKTTRHYKKFYVFINDCNKKNIFPSLQYFTEM